MKYGSSHKAFWTTHFSEGWNHKVSGLAWAPDQLYFLKAGVIK